ALPICRPRARPGFRTGPLGTARAAPGRRAPPRRDRRAGGGSGRRGRRWPGCRSCRRGGRVTQWIVPDATGVDHRPGGLRLVFVLVIGGGKVGYYLTKELIDSGHEVVLMENDKDRANQSDDEIRATCY